MLTELRIVNFAIIDQLTVQFSAGFQVLTGETGAGKSILVDAIALLVGGRASADQIRSDTDEAVLEAVFSLAPADPPHPIIAGLREQAVLGAEETDVIIRRVLSRSGRHRLYLNGSPTPLHVIQSLAGTLIDIHGQHEQQSLLSQDAQLDALDAFGGLRPLRDQYAEQYAHWGAVRREVEEAERSARERHEREDMLRFQYRELQDAGLRAGEEDELAAEQHRLAHGRRLAELSGEAYELLYERESAILTVLGAVSARLKELTAIDGSASEWAGPMESAMAQLRELARHLQVYQEGLNQDPERLGQIEERLDRLQRLRKKYGGSDAALLAKLTELAQDVEALDSGDSRLADLHARMERESEALTRLARQLSDGRTKAAAKMERRVKAELAELKMDTTRFRIEVSPDPEGAWGPSGADRVAYRLSANEGEPLQPLARVASGGELSRVMLAIKTVLAEADRVPVLIFDEVDAGVGGAVAAVMGKRLKALGGYHQVFCITHLPQVASQADTHYLVKKETVKKRTVATVSRLDPAGRREEVARMLGGLSITSTVRKTAAEMIGGPGS